jgi:hypothetical protein
MEEYYDIPFHKEFDVKALLGLQYDFNNLPDGHVKAKRDLIDTMQLIQRNLHLTPKLKMDNPIKLIIVVNNSTHLREVFEIIELMLGTNIKFVVNTKTHGRFKTDNLEIDIFIKSENLRGKRCDVYWNLTGDLKFENEVLKPMVIR